MNDLTIHSLKCIPLISIIRQTQYSIDVNMEQWIGKGRLNGKAMAEIAAFVKEVKGVYTDEYGQYIFDLEGYEFDLKLGQTNYVLNIMRSIR